MERQSSARFINVDELMPQVTLEQAAAYYGVLLPELNRVGDETRARCFLVCGRTHETGDRALAIQTDHPAKQWKCHQYGCGKAGNLVSLCDLIKPGTNAGGRPRGDRFKQIAADLLAMSQGMFTAAAIAAPTPPATAKPPEPLRNLPLAQSDNERARCLTNLDAKFITDPARMPPAAGSYFRQRKFLFPEVCQKWRMGYLPRDTGGEDKTGGTMRGRVAYAYLSETGDVLTWFGRDPEHEEKHARWIAGGRSDREPEKFHFVKGFHRGVELFGQHRLQESATQARLKDLGFLTIVEGSNDVVALDALGVPAVGLCSNTITSEQAVKIGRFATQYTNGTVLLMLDCDPEGENGVSQVLPVLAEHAAVRLAWSSRMHGGRFKGRQPESVKLEDWTRLCAAFAGWESVQP